jgi:hypothetical protein
MKTLNVIETAYRATLEEQDDTILWLSQALRGAGAEIGILLGGNAVSYGVQLQDASGLSFGGLSQTQPPHLADDVSRFVEGGAPVYVVEEDLAQRGIVASELVPGLKTLRRSEIASLYDQFDRVWCW